MPRLNIPDRFNLARCCLERSALATPDKTALIVVGNADRPEMAERWTYAALDHAVRCVAAGLLAEGLVPGDRLMLRLPNTSDYALLFLGAISAGLVPIPVSSQLTESEIGFLVEDSAAAAIARIGSSAPTVPPGCKIVDDETIARLKASPPLADR